jgi:hypothetical protein
MLGGGFLDAGGVHAGRPSQSCGGQASVDGSPCLADGLPGDRGSADPLRVASCAALPPGDRVVYLESTS